MLCPKCNSTDTKVVDSRQTCPTFFRGATLVRRRRRCLRGLCQHAFTTYEMPAEAVKVMGVDIVDTLSELLVKLTAALEEVKQGRNTMLSMTREQFNGEVSNQNCGYDPIHLGQ